jgi:hypothetical protein
MDDLASPSLSDYSLENAITGPAPPSSKGTSRLNGGGAKPRAQRRPSNRDEFDGPHQFLKRPPAEYIAMQERELPRLPTHLLVQEQDSVLNQVNDRLAQCAFDFVAKYQFPIPLTQDMRPVERPQDREWTEWVYLLKRLATKRRIPARVLYNGQIKQFVTILENSLEMRHAAKHQSRPLKDDRNILQLISAGIQVAKILKDAQAMVRSFSCLRGVLFLPPGDSGVGGEDFLSYFPNNPSLSTIKTNISPGLLGQIIRFHGTADPGAGCGSSRRFWRHEIPLTREKEPSHETPLDDLAVFTAWLARPTEQRFLLYFSHILRSGSISLDPFAGPDGQHAHAHTFHALRFCRPGNGMAYRKDNNTTTFLWPLLLRGCRSTCRTRFMPGGF